MKHLLLTTITAVVLVGCGPSMSIHEASESRNIQAVKQNLEAGTNVNSKGDDGNTPLHYAAFQGHTEIVELLITGGADINERNVEKTIF
jgi:ankyrin repeat protein